ncbi:hypothetical protein [Mesorhizobium sp.]|uniref:hypothetical protein n=1 Tax=Mesorhizobium sp. TaxID=1871066 RepID=UPI002586DEAE|nr:hypothetical protein [Mesorhizobium sp.]
MNGIVSEDKARHYAIDVKAVGKQSHQGNRAARSFDQGWLWPFGVKRPHRGCNVGAGFVHRHRRVPAGSLELDAATGRKPGLDEISEQRADVFRSLPVNQAERQSSRGLNGRANWPSLA